MIKIKKNRFFAAFSVLLLATMFLLPANSHASDPKQLYLDGGTDLSRTPPTGSQPGTTINSEGTHTWVQTPALQSAVTIDSNSDVPVSLNINTNNHYVYVDVTLTCSGGGSSTSARQRINNNSVEPFSFSIPLNNSITCAAGDTWSLTVQNKPYKLFGFIDLGGPIDIYPVNAGEISRVVLPSLNVINVDSVEFYDAPYPNGNLITSAGPNDTIYIRSIVSDPFGSFDISSATVDLIDGNGTAVGTPFPVAMNEVHDSTAATKTYEYSYTIPVAPAVGDWSAKVTAEEGTEGTITRDKTGSIAISISDLSTSSKSVTDINGGDANPGNVLRYTITLNETAGHAALVSVTDNIPENVSNFTLLSFPAGATDNSTGSGTGDNGTGYLDITNITVPANGSETITFDVTIISMAADGALIDNTATITNPAGTGATTSAPTIIISAPSSPVSGNKPLYLYDDTSSPQYKLSRVKPSGLTDRRRVNSNEASKIWTLDPTLAGDVTTISGNNIPVILWISNTTTRKRNRRVEVRLACSSTPGTYATSGKQTIKAPSKKKPKSFTFNLSGNLPMTCSAGDSWELTVVNRASNDNRDIYVYPMSGSDNSYVNLPSQNVINVDNVAFYDDSYANGGGNPVTTVSAGDTIYIRSVVSDPFGSFDINGAELTLTDAAGTPVASVSPAAMTEVNDSGAATKTYEYRYDIPTFPAQGTWTAEVKSFEGTEGTIDHTSLATFLVTSAPQLTILKSADSATASPGQVITYSVIITNSGGPATNVVIDDDISPYTAWDLNSFGSGIPFSLTQLAPGSPADSGLTIGTAVYYDESDTVITPVSNGGGAGAGFDGRVNRFELPMSGTMVPGGQFKLEYKVKVK